MTLSTIAFSIVCNNDSWLAINKPAGINMHSEDGQAGLAVQLAEQLNCPLWPVHRLDKVTSGLLLFAKNKKTTAELSALFAQRLVDKYYLAISSHKPAKKQGWVKGDMSKSRNGSWKLQRTRHNPAITRFVSHYDEQTQKRLFLLNPRTGKTHQLRVAMKSLSAPIDGDQRYAGVAAGRTFLHAYALCFADQQIICPPVAEGWEGIPEIWEAPWEQFS